MSGKKIDLGMTAYDDLFQTDESRVELAKDKIEDVDRSLIDAFPNHPFKVRMDNAMSEMVESIKRYGVLVPAIIRPKDDGRFEMIAGHRRDKASDLAGNGTLPCIIRNLSDDEATIIMVDSNLQREELLPSEKAFAYKMRLEAMKRQGERTDLTSRPLGEKLFSVEKMSAEVTDSSRQIHRYIRLTELTPEILQMVDDKQIAFRPAVEISYLLKEEQHALLETMESEDCTPSLEQAQRMKRLSGDGRLNVDVIFSILTEEKPNQKEQFKMPKERIAKYFPTGTPVQKIEDTIIKALELYQRRQRQQER